MSLTACHICELGSSATDAQIVYRDGEWTIASPVPVPGWMMLFPDRHNDGAWDVDEKAALRLGPLLVALTGAVREATGAERVYSMYQGENALHFHFLVMPRGADVPQEWRGAGLVGRHAELVDADRSAVVLDKVRELLGARLGTL